MPEFSDNLVLSILRLEVHSSQNHLSFVCARFDLAIFLGDLFRSLNMDINNYIEKINKLYKTGNATEHSYRGDLQQLILSIVPDVLVTNEPARIKCGAPDYILTKKDIPIGYIEAKDIGVDLEHKSHKEQFDRYRASLQNLIFTDYLSFHLYIDGEFKTKVQIAEIKNGKIVPIASNFSVFIDLIKNFCLFQGQTIKSSSKLAEMMAKKARMLENIIEKAIQEDIEANATSSIRDQMDAFRKILIHDIKPKQFADIYAQTIAYGMFAARFHDKTLETFSRQEAAELIPKSNPFLRSLFSYIAGPEIDDRIKWIVESLAEIFRAADVGFLLKDFGKATQTQDPIIHFYETFLTEYDPALRKARGVWYTPHPVVNFITRAIDEILKSEFGIKAGVADQSMIDIDVNNPGEKKPIKKKVHRVQFLDPATGTGTFIAELIRQVFEKFKGQEGIWSNYVEKHLIPRLHGFEILMASYAMAHLKIDMLLQETEFKPTKNQRLKIYLTNSLEEYHEDDRTLFALARWLSDEAQQANDVKRDTPVMVVMGNPPYSVSSSNKGEWIQGLVSDYKKDLNEKNIQPLSDDYIKFIRFGQHFIEKTGEGILAYITNNSFIDGIIHRQMRKHLLECFDKIYILDLHGNAKKKELSPDGSKDENVFDIMQGVSINLFIKTGKKKSNDLGKVFHFDLFGKRDYKYDFLNGKNIKLIKWNTLKYSYPNYFFVKKNFDKIETYERGFKIDDFFEVFGPGVETGLDRIFVADDKNELLQTFKKIASKSEDVFRTLKIENKPSFKVKNKLLAENFTKITDSITSYQYKVFDFKFITYFKNSLRRADYNVFKNISNDNLFLTLMRSAVDTDSFKSILISKSIIDKNLYSFQTYAFPLYIYHDNKGLEKLSEKVERQPNLNTEILKQITQKLDLIFSNEKETKKNTFAPIDILDYIYAVLHSPTYREKYKEFLKIDFPRVPYPEDKDFFWNLVKLGGQIRQIHLLESPVVEQYITNYPLAGNNIIDKIKYEEGNVYINETQYFSGVPEIAWNFYIGGYQPAQRWLNERKGRELSFEDISHYQKIIVALTETDRLMKEIDTIEIE